MAFQPDSFTFCMASNPPAEAPIPTIRKPGGDESSAVDGTCFADGRGPFERGVGFGRATLVAVFGVGDFFQKYSSCGHGILFSRGERRDFQVHSSRDA